MSRSTSSILALAAVALLFAGCGGDDDSSNTIDAGVQDVGSQTETGTGVGRGRGGGGLDEADGGDATLDGSVDGVSDGGQPVDAIVKTDAMVKVDAPSACKGTCDDINKRYLEAVDSAKGCLTTGSEQCGISEPSSLICGMTIPVNTNGALKRIQKEWADAACNLCPRKACIEPITPRGTVFCRKNTTNAAVQPIGPNVSIIDPGIIVLPPINLNDGTCDRKLLIGI